MNTRFALAIAALAASTPAALAQMGNFLVADSRGVLYEIDGATLEATELATLEYGNNISEILYMGNNEIMASTLGGFVRYNLSTGAESIEFNSRDFAPGAPTVWIESACFTAQRNMYFGATEWDTNGGVRRYGMLYNPHTGAFTQLPDQTNAQAGLYFDFIEIDNHVFLASDASDLSIRTFDADTGDTLSVLDIGAMAFSFFDFGGTVYAIGEENQVFSIDLDDGSLVAQGQITGLIEGRYVIAATNVTVPRTFDINYDGSNDFFDLTDFIQSFGAREPIADWNDDGMWDFFDISGFIGDFGAE